MKIKIIVLILFLVLLIKQSNCQQFYIDKIYTARDLKSIWFTDASKGFAVGDKGAIKSTSDGGKTWKWLTLTTKDLKKVFFVTNDIGLIVGDKIILRTTDGGVTWSTIAIDDLILDVHFASNSMGVMAGSSFTYKTTDAGLTWTKVSSSPLNPKPSQLFFVNENIGYGTTGFSGTGSSIIKTINGGTSWSRVYSNNDFSEEFNGVNFIDENTGYVVSKQGKILKTTDGGSTWNIQVNNSRLNLSTVRFSTKDFGIAVGTEGLIPEPGLVPFGSSHICLTTTNGGSSWTKTNLFDGPGLAASVTSSSFFAGGNVIGNTIYCAGERDHIYKSIDGGKAWVNQSGFGRIQTVFFINENVAVAAGGGIYKTVDGGKNWRVVKPAINFPSSKGDPYWNANTIQFTTSNIGYIGGGSGARGGLIKTIDQGETWQVIEDGTAPFWDFDFTDVDNGFFATGSFSTVLKKTTNGGTTLTSGPVIGAGKIEFVSPLIGFHETGAFSTAEDEIIYKTTNGGSSWSKLLTVPANKGHDFSALRFFDTSTGYAIGNNGSIYKTIDAGNSWQLYPSTITNERLADIAFYDSKIGFIVGFDGSILRTNDAGATWGLEAYKVDILSYGFSSRFFNFINGKGFIGKDFSIYSLGTTPIKQDQTITFAPLIDRTVGDAPFTLTATSTSGLPVAFASSSARLTINGTQATIVSAGRVTVTASQVGNASFNAAANVERSFCSKPAKPTISQGAGGEIVTLTSSSATNNLWYKDGVLIPNATAATLTVTQPGSYTLRVQVDDCPSEVSAPTLIVITGDGDVPSLAGSELKIFPNPVSSQLIIHLPGIGTKEVSILNAVGSRVESIHTTRSMLTLDASQYLSGLYFVRVKSDRGNHFSKFIKE